MISTMLTYQSASIPVSTLDEARYTCNYEKRIFHNAGTVLSFKDLGICGNTEQSQWKIAKSRDTQAIPIGTREKILSNHQIILPVEIQFAYREKEKIFHYQKQFKIEETLYYIFECIETSLIESKYECCNELLRVSSADIDKYRNEVLISILTASLPWKKKLPFREAFFNDVKRKILLEYDKLEANAILLGLD